MAIASGGTLGTGASSTSNSSYTFTTATNTLASGDFAVLVSVSDNTSTTDGNNNEHTSVSGGTGTWTKIGEHCNSNAAAGAGVVVSLWLFVATGTVATGTTITLNFASARTDKCCAFWKFTKAAGTSVGLDTQPASNPITNDTDAANGFGSVAFSGLSSYSRLYLRGLGKEANSTTGLTVSTSFTELTGTRSRNNASAVLVRGEFRVNASTGETSNPTLAVTGDTAGLFVALRERLEGTVSETVATTTSEAPAWTTAGSVAETVATTTSEAPAWTTAGSVAETAAIAGTATGSSPATGGVGVSFFGDPLPRVVDTFTRADGGVGAFWQSTGNQGTVSGAQRSYAGSEADEKSLFWVSRAARAFPPDQFAEVKYNAVGGGDIAGPAVRCSPRGAYLLYLDGISDSSRRLRRRVGVTYTSIGTVNHVASAGDVFRLAVRGNVLSVYKNGALVETVRDGFFRDGQPGIFNAATNIGATRLDNFVAGALAADRRPLWFGTAAPGVSMLALPGRARAASRNQPKGVRGINWSNPLSNGIVAAAIVPPEVNGRLWLDVANRSPGVFRTNGAFAPAAGHPARSHGGTAASWVGRPVINGVDPKLSIVQTFTAGTASQDNRWLFAISQQIDGAGVLLGIRYTGAGGNEIGFLARGDGNTSAVSVATGIVLTPGREYTVGVSWDLSKRSPSTFDVAINGALYSFAYSNQATGLQYTCDLIALGGIARYSGPTLDSQFSNDARIGATVLYNRKLTAGELQSITADPYQVFATPPRPHWFGTAGGATTHNAIAAESVGTTSAQTVAQDTTGTVAETAAIVDAGSATWTGDAAVSIALSVTTAEAGTLTTAGTVAETVATTTSEAQDGAAVLTVGEFIGATDSASLVASWAVLAAMQLAVTDADAAVATFEATAAETVVATSSQAQDGAVVLTVAETVGTTTSEAATWSGAVVVSETVVGQTLEQVAAQFVAAVAETVAQVSAQAAGATIDGAVAETIGTTSPVAVSLTLTGDVAFDLGVFDLVGGTQQSTAAVVFNAALAEQVAAAIAYQVGAVESVAIVEQIDATKFAAVVGLPDGRTLIVRVEARTRVVDVEARTFTVRAEQRRDTVEQENRTVEIPAESRTFTIH